MVPLPRAPHPLLLALGAVALATALLAPSILAQESPRVRILDAASAGSKGWQAFDTPGPALFDIDGDGGLEIVDQHEGRKVVVVDAASGRLRAELDVPYPPYWGARPLNEVAVARMAPGQEPSLLVGNSAGMVVRYQFQGEQDGRFLFERLWTQRLEQFEDNPGMDGAVVTADLDGDGRLEILAQTEQRGIYALRADGSTLWSAPVGGGNAEPAAGDLDGDGRMEAVFSSDGGHITVVDGPTGKHEWTYWSGHHVRPASLPRSATLADLEGDGKLEVLFTARDARDEENLRANHFALIVLEHDGKERFAARPAWGNPLTYTHLVAADATGDGTKEIYGMDWNTIGHKPGNWERLGKANVFSFSASGKELWHTAVENSWSNDDVAVTDFDGDGALEVLAVGSQDGRDGLLSLDARTGKVEEHVQVWPWMAVRGPVVGDVDGDGSDEAVFSVHGMAEGTKGGAFAVVRARGGGAPASPAPEGPAEGDGAEGNVTDGNGTEANATEPPEEDPFAEDPTAEDPAPGEGGSDDPADNATGEDGSADNGTAPTPTEPEPGQDPAPPADDGPAFEDPWFEEPWPEETPPGPAPPAPEPAPPADPAPAPPSEAEPAPPAAKPPSQPWNGFLEMLGSLGNGLLVVLRGLGDGLNAAVEGGF